MYLRIFGICVDTAHFLTAPGLACQAAAKKSKAQLDLLTEIDMLLMAEKGILLLRICLAIYRDAKANNKYMRDCDKNRKSSYLKYWDVNNLYGGAMSEKLPVNDFKWVKIFII